MKFHKKGFEFAFSHIMKWVLLLALLIIVLIFYGSIRDTILVLIDKMFGGG